MKAPPGYQLHRLRGRGSRGQVWEATAPDGMPVALKFLPCAKGTPVSHEIRRLLRLRELQHPHLIPLYDVLAGSEHLIMVMERAEGNLDDLSVAYKEELGTPIPPNQLCSLLAGAAEALDFVARQGASSACLQHCNVKPSNLLLVGDQVKVGDFRLNAQTQSTSTREEFRATAPYAAPELYERRISPRIDQYALAVTYCKLRSDRLPFVVADPLSSAHQKSAPDLSMLCPRERPVVARALEVNWLDRWPSCTAFSDALSATLGLTAATRFAPLSI